MFAKVARTVSLCATANIRATPYRPGREPERLDVMNTSVPMRSR